MKKLTVLLAVAAICVSAAGLRAQVGACSANFTPQCKDTQTIATSGSTATIRSNGGLAAVFEEVITGSPATVSIVIQGCGDAGTCTTLDTYTTVANTVRTPVLTAPYAYYRVTATWTGGTSPTVTVNTRMTTAANVHSGGSPTFGNINATGSVTAGGTNPVTIGGAAGSCTGKVAMADGTGCTNVASANASVFSPRNTYTLPTTGWTGQTAEGDSITCGVGAVNSSCSTAGYVNILNTYIGSPTLHNYGASGKNSCYITWSVFANESPAYNDGILRTLDVLMNDKTSAPPVQYQAIQQCENAAITWETSPASTKYLESSFGTLPTNWTADTTTIPGLTVLSTTTTASPAVFNCTGVAIDLFVAPYGYCFLWFAHLDANSAGNGASNPGAYFSYKMDSGALSYLPLSSAPPAGVTAPSGTVYGNMDVVAIPMATAGTHTVTVTPYLNAGDTATFVGTGTNYGAFADPLLVFGLNYTLNDAYEPTMAQLYDQEKTLIQQVQSEGLYAYFVPTRNCMLGNPSEMYLGEPTYVHPNLTGHQEMAQCAEQPLQTTPVKTAVPDPSLYGSQRALVGNGPWNISANDQVVNAAPTANAYAYLPAMPAIFTGLKTITIVNTASAYTVTVGGNYMSGAPIATIYPNGIATFYNQGGVQWYIQSSTPMGSLALRGCQYESSSFSLDAFKPVQDCIFLSGSSPIVVTLPTTMVVGKEWHLVNNGTANVTFTGASNGNANALVLYPGDAAVLNSPYSGYINVVSFYSGTHGTTGSIGGSSLGAGVCTSGTATIANLPTSGVALKATPATYPGDGFYWNVYGSATGTATVKVCNGTAGALTPTASTYYVSR